ncbi:DUF3114 domain-containing protein [Weissella cibaria]|uniref:DUF3114 domain-containing protein n=1 Tax=Weissella cibaria TaxID=137591 RepID=UPI0018975756|nr:DUF3114 domain-containing protein [Weissella cibaria]
MLFKRTRELIENPKGVDVHRAAMSAALLGQTEVLTADGWLPKAVAAYVEAVATAPELTDHTMTGVLTQKWYEAHRIGSSLFTKMLISGFHRGSATATDRLGMLYQVLGLQRDDTNFVQMTHLGDWAKRDMTPNLYYLQLENETDLQDYWDFVNRVAFLMRLKYRAWNGIRSRYATSKQLTATFDNQLRYYLGKPVSDFVRHMNWTRAQYEAKVLLFTGKEVLHPGVALHNRGVADQSNVKVVTPDYHVELIFDRDDQIVSLWDALEEQQIEMADGSLRFVQDPAAYSLTELQQIANTESANYAGQGGKIHEALDVKPAARTAGLESDLRNYAKNQF